MVIHQQNANDIEAAHKSFTERINITHAFIRRGQRESKKMRADKTNYCQNKGINCRELTGIMSPVHSKIFVSSTWISRNARNPDVFRSLNSCRKEKMKWNNKRKMEQYFERRVLRNFGHSIYKTHKCHRPSHRMRSIDDSKSICWTRCAILLARARATHYSWCVGRWKVRERNTQFLPKIHRSKSNAAKHNRLIFHVRLSTVRTYVGHSNIRQSYKWVILCGKFPNTIDMATRDFFS